MRATTPTANWCGGNQVWPSASHRTGMAFIGAMPIVNAAVPARLEGWRRADMRLCWRYEQISRFISFTAASIPTMMARATMLWPMLSSHMLGISATGRTFW